MIRFKQFDNGLKLIVNKMDGVFSVACGVLVKTGSANECAEDNGISHFIEHTMFKGTSTRSAFEISDYIDRIGAQINAFTSKEMTCYYTKSISEHTGDALNVLSDIFFNSVFDETELKKEKGVVIEEINMCEDEPEEICLDLLASSFYGDTGLGQTILGSAKNIKKFAKADIKKYMDKYYTADNVVISVAGNVDADTVEKIVKDLFADKFSAVKSQVQMACKPVEKQFLNKYKRTEQAHIGFCMPALPMDDKRSIALSIANVVFGGGMSSRLFQKVREEMGLCYSIYSYVSQYKDSGVLEIYSGVNVGERDSAVHAIVDELEKFKAGGVTASEYERGKEQIKSAFVLGQENTSSQMLLYGRYMLFFGEIFDFADRIKRIENTDISAVNDIVSVCFNVNNASTATVGPKHTPIKL